MIKMTLNELMNATPALKELSGKSFTGATTFKIARLIREVDKEIKTFEEERMKIVNKYGEKDENGELASQEDGTVKIIEDKINECNQELVDLLNAEVEINAEKLKEEVFEKIELTPVLAIAIEGLVE